MKIEVPFGKSVFRVAVEIGISPRFPDSPLLWSLRDQRKLAREIQKRMGTAVYVSQWAYEVLHFRDDKIGRIRACRYILQERGLSCTLVISKEFVEVAFADNGKGSEVVL
jgi:hypothetical protein